MSDNADCPSPDQLHRALTGDLPPDRIVAIEQHLSECGPCAEQTLHSGDLQTYSQVLRQSSQAEAEAVSKADAEQLEQLIARLRELPHQQQVTQLSGDQEDSRNADLESELVSYLQPARAAEELGWLGTYRVLKLLGSGGMGGVFLAEDTQLHRRVALKVMRPDVSGQVHADERFLREARAAAAVHHDHIVTIFQVGRDGQVPFLAMEFLEGESLEDRLRRERVMPLTEVLRIGREIAEGLAAAHSRGLVHRDIKPANIWLETRYSTVQTDAVNAQPPRVKLLDFGLARAADANFELTSQGMVIGTPAYMAPEQAAGDTVDHRADLFSFGVVLYRLATGALPFQGKDAISTLVSIKSDTPDDPRLRRQDLPEELSDLILRLLRKNPVERPTSAAEVAKQLTRIALTLSVSEIPANIPTTHYQSKPPSKGALWRVIAAFVFLVLLSGVFVIATDRGQVKVVIDSKDKDVDIEVVVTRPDGYFQVFDKKTGSQVKGFWSGKYEVEIKGDANSFEVDKTDFVLKRGKTEILTVTRRPASETASIVGPAKNPANVAQSVLVPEPPPLSEWLKGRKVLTVAQDGSGQFKTIQAALDALQPGESVKVLDKGPYREHLELHSPPADSGLVTEVQTILELPEWKPHHKEPDAATGGEISVYAGHVLGSANGFRLHGFDMNFPASDGKLCRRLLINRTKDLVLENCLIRASTSHEGEPVDVGDWEAGDGVGISAWMRECVIEGSIAFTTHAKAIPADPRHRSKVVIEHNYFLGEGTDHHLFIAGQAMQKLVIRHNVFAGKSNIDISLVRLGASVALEVSNNTLLSPCGISLNGSIPQGSVTIRNNLHSRDAIVAAFNADVKDLHRAVPGWHMDHNAYPDRAAAVLPENVVPKQPGDLSELPRYLSKVPKEADYLRIPADDSLATAGAGGKWPQYLGALPPGPAPKDGDWFTRLREREAIENVKQPTRSAPAEIPEPPALAEWLKGRKVLTVAQDGSGQFTTIQAAMDALQSGQTIKVLDKGPYREWLHVPALPADSGLVTEVQTILEGPEWKLAGQENDAATGGKFDVYGGHMLNGADGFRLHGFEMRFPASNGKSLRRGGGTRTKGFVLENCIFHASNSYDGDPFGLSDWHDGDGVGMSLWMRDCVFEGSLVVAPNHKAVPLDPKRQSTAVIERNYFAGVGTRQHLMIIGESMRAVVIRHNVFAGKSGIDINLSLFDASDSLEITNNLLLSPTGITFQERAPRGDVIIRNNIHTQDSIVHFSTGLKLRETARSWNMDHNTYPDLRERASSEHLLPRPPGDLVTMPRFISKVPQERDYLRIPMDDPLAKAGAGGALPEYLGALVPGPAPKEGDWFTQLLER